MVVGVVGSPKNRGRNSDLIKPAFLWNPPARRHSSKAVSELSCHIVDHLQKPIRMDNGFAIWPFSPFHLFRKAPHGNHVHIEEGLHVLDQIRLMGLAICPSPWSRIFFSSGGNKFDGSLRFRLPENPCYFQQCSRSRPIVVSPRRNSVVSMSQNSDSFLGEFRSFEKTRYNNRVSFFCHGLRSQMNLTFTSSKRMHELQPSDSGDTDGRKLLFTKAILEVRIPSFHTHTVGPWHGVNENHPHRACASSPISKSAQPKLGISERFLSENHDLPLGIDSSIVFILPVSNQDDIGFNSSATSRW